MHYKYINVNLVGGECLNIKDATITDDGGTFIRFDAERVFWDVPPEQIRYIKVPKTESEQ